MFNRNAESYSNEAVIKTGRGLLHLTLALLFVYVLAVTLSTLQGYVDNYKTNKHKDVLCKKFGGSYCAR